MRGRVFREPEHDEYEAKDQRNGGPDDGPGPGWHREEERKRRGEKEHHASVDRVVDRDRAEGHGARQPRPPREKLDADGFAGAHGQDHASGLAHVVAGEHRSPGRLGDGAHQREPARPLTGGRADPERRRDGEEPSVRRGEGVADGSPADAAGEDHHARRDHQPDEHAGDGQKPVLRAARRCLRAHAPDLLLAGPQRERPWAIDARRRDRQCLEPTGTAFAPDWEAAPDDGLATGAPERAGTPTDLCPGCERAIGAVFGRYMGTAPEGITCGCVRVRASTTGTALTGTRVCFSTIRGGGPARGPWRTGIGRTRGKVTCGMGTAWPRTGCRKLPASTKTQ